MSAGPSPRATVGGLVAVLLWSGTVALARSAAEAVGPVTTAAAACSVGGALSLASLAGSGARRRRIRQLPRRYLAGCGALFMAYMLLLFLAVGGAADRTQTLTVGLLNYLWPPLTVVLSLVLLDLRANRLLGPGLLLASGGIVLVVTAGSGLSWRSLVGALSADPVPAVLAVGAAVTWALYSTLTRRWAGGRDAGAVAVFLPATALVLVLVAGLRHEPGAWSARARAEVLVLGLATWAAYSLWDGAMRRGNVVLVAAASYLTPLLSTLVSCLYLAVVPAASLWLGCGLLIAGSWLSWRAVDGRPARR